MDARFSKQQLLFDRDLDSENSPEDSGGSPMSAVLPDDSDAKAAAAATSSKQSKRRAVQKRVVSVPINDVEGSNKIKNEISFPPSDSWAWRKYGQKPIKGSPYPRGYYRCSSSKGCPAKKQVERSRVDPQMLVVTYSCEHNHPWPATTAASRNHRTAAAAVAGTVTMKTSSRSNKDGRKEETAAAVSDSEDARKEASDPDSSPRAPEAGSDGRGDQFASHLGSGGGVEEEFGWFPNFDQTGSAVTEECSVLTEAKLVACADQDMPSLIFPVGEEDGEDESLFADLGELPECSREFGLGMMERDESRRRQSLPPWCGTA